VGRKVVGVWGVVKENTKGIVLFRGVEGVEDGSRWKRRESTADQGRCGREQGGV
jgi:hypothetical protein